MRYADRYFQFPVRIYDRFSSEKAMQQERELNLLSPMEGEWREGKVRLPYQEITCWSDYFDSEQGPEGVDADGFLSTIIWTEKEGSFISTWNKTKFEKELSDYVEKYEAWFDTISKEEDLEL